MKPLFILLFCLISSLGMAFNCTAFCPEADIINCVNMYDFPLSLGGVANGQQCVFLYDGLNWETHVAQYGSLPVVSTCMLDENNLLAAMGMGTYSDGIYRFNLIEETWQLCDWFYFPNFVTRHPGSSTFYCGERDGLFKSANGIDWFGVSALGSGTCTSIAFRDSCIVANSDNFIYYSHNSGLTWQQSQSGSLKGFHFASDGTLYGIMNVGSDSDGLWCSYDAGVTWNAVYYTTNLSAIGPDYNGYLSLGWDTVNELGCYVALLSPTQQLIPLAHEDLSSPVKQLDVFPWIDTLSIYVLNNQGGYFLTGFLPVAVDDPLQTPPPSLSVYPNPVSSTVRIQYADKNTSEAVCNVYNIRGQQVHSFVWNKVNAAVSWNLRDTSGRRMPSGVYLIELRDKRGVKLGTTRLSITD